MGALQIRLYSFYKLISHVTHLYDHDRYCNYLQYEGSPLKEVRAKTKRKKTLNLAYQVFICSFQYDSILDFSSSNFSSETSFRSIMSSHFYVKFVMLWFRTIYIELLYKFFLPLKIKIWWRIVYWKFYRTACFSDWLLVKWQIKWFAWFLQRVQIAFKKLGNKNCYYCCSEFQTTSIIDRKMCVNFCYCLALYWNFHLNNWKDWVFR